MNFIGFLIIIAIGGYVIGASIVWAQDNYQMWNCVHHHSICVESNKGWVPLHGK